MLVPFLLLTQLGGALVELRPRPTPTMPQGHTYHAEARPLDALLLDLLQARLRGKAHGHGIRLHHSAGAVMKL
jgi:hypothetical protein